MRYTSGWFKRTVFKCDGCDERDIHTISISSTQKREIYLCKKCTVKVFEDYEKE